MDPPPLSPQKTAVGWRDAFQSFRTLEGYVLSRPYTMSFGANSACGISRERRQRGDTPPPNVAPIFAECCLLRG